MNTLADLENQSEENENVFSSYRYTFSLFSIQGKVFWTSFAFVALIVLFTGVVFWKTNAISGSIQRITSESKPITYELSQLRLGVANMLKAQASFFVTQANSYRQERLTSWRELVEPSSDNLYELSLKLSEEGFRTDIGVLRSDLEEFRSLQDGLDAYFIQNAVGNTINVSQNSADRIAEYQQQQNRVAEYVHQYFEENIRPKQNEIDGHLQKMLDMQRALLEEDVNVIQENSERFRGTMFGVLIVSLLITSLLGYILVNSLQKSIAAPIDQIQKIADGQIPQELPPSKDELNAVIQATNRLKKNLQHASHFAQQIGEGDLEMEYEPASGEDILGNALLNMGKRLRKVSEEDQNRNWASQGLSEFVELIRDNQQDFQRLSEDFITKLVRYLKINQGGLFTLEERQGDEYLLLRAAYAYDRQKYLEKEMMIDDDFGEGLIGQAFLEKKTLHLTDVPSEYAYVTSGLGKATPRNVLIVPMQLNERVEGMIELASFKPFAPHEVTFVEDLAESFASTLVTVKNSDAMKRLLQESQSKGEQMQAQEEEMRQNMEELTATQEEMKRKQQELEKIKQDLEMKIRNTEMQLQKASHKMTTINSFPMLICTRNQHWNLSDMAGNSTAVTGYSSPEFLKQQVTYKDFIHPEDLIKLNTYFQQLASQENSHVTYECKYRFKNKLGEVRWFLEQGTFTKGRVAAEYSVKCVIADITEIRPIGKAI